ncbi:DUF421 domain-containing protein [Paenibacillus dakarensis]|uniref:DUF421 domain-containing protein n=1 Tax=Paenibacillus dakarensis TaxID=1527293 RepID=UPI0006D58B62|nr:DUF421 domain-containing protein [Paenibacillus dakarensis]
MQQWLEIVLRTLCAVVVLFLLTKMLGKRQVSQLSSFEYITGITIGSLTAYISLDLESDWYLGIIAVAVWAAVSLLIELVQMKSKWIRDFIDFKATVLIKEGKILEGNLKKERLTTDELMEQLRKKNVFDIADVEFAIMESSGEINIMLVSEKQPLTPKHLGIQTGSIKEPQTVIMDGKVMSGPLALSGKNQEWLKKELNKNKVKPEEVYLGQVDSSGQLVLDLYDDKISLPQVRQKAALFANLKKCEADLEMFSMAATTEESKELYANTANRLHQLLSEVKPLLQQKKK